MNIANNINKLLIALLAAHLLSHPTAGAQEGVLSETEIQESEDLTAADFIPVATPEQAAVQYTDASSSVLNKNIKFSKRFKFDLDAGTLADELIVNTKYTTMRLSYYINEDYSFGVGYRSRYGGATSYSKQMLDSASQVDFSRAPTPERAGFVSFGYNLLYGKVSLLKNISLPTITKLNTDFGAQAFGKENRPFIQTSIEQTFMLGSYVGLGLNVGFGFAEITDATSANVNVSQPVPAESNFSSKIQFNKFFGAHLNIIL